ARPIRSPSARRRRIRPGSRRRRAPSHARIPGTSRPPRWADSPRGPGSRRARRFAWLLPTQSSLNIVAPLGLTSSGSALDTRFLIRGSPRRGRAPLMGGPAGPPGIAPALLVAGGGACASPRAPSPESAPEPPPAANAPEEKAQPPPPTPAAEPVSIPRRLGNEVVSDFKWTVNNFEADPEDLGPSPCPGVEL